jgi:multicomponent Na+:H+ antiporter subunit F
VTQFYASVCLAELALAALLVVRHFIGPTVSDRLVALNTMSTQATLCVFFFAAFAQRTIYLDVSIWLCSFSYLATIVWARYLERGFL